MEQIILDFGSIVLDYAFFSVRDQHGRLNTLDKLKVMDGKVLLETLHAIP